MSNRRTGGSCRADGVSSRQAPAQRLAAGRRSAARSAAGRAPRRAGRPAWSRRQARPSRPTGSSTMSDGTDLRDLDARFMTGVQDRGRRGSGFSGQAADAARGRGCAAAAPRDETAQRQRQAGVDEDDAAGRRDAGDGLTGQAEHFAGVREAKDRAELARRAVAGRTAPTSRPRRSRDSSVSVPRFCGWPPLPWSMVKTSGAAVALVGTRRLMRAPAGHLPLGAGQMALEAGEIGRRGGPAALAPCARPGPPSRRAPAPARLPGPRRPAAAAPAAPRRSRDRRGCSPTDRR